MAESKIIQTAGGKFTYYTPTITAPRASGFSADNSMFAYKITKDFLYIWGRFRVANAGSGNSEIVITYPSGISAVATGARAALGPVFVSKSYSNLPLSMRADSTTSFHIQAGAGGINANQLIGSNVYVSIQGAIPLV